jgi:hypothetical protein
VLIVAVYCLLVSICIAGGLLHCFTWAEVVPAIELVVSGLLVGVLVFDFEEQAINGIMIATIIENMRSIFGYFIVPPKKLRVTTMPYIIL